ncbi:uncharacterized protein LOC111250315 [Varroa destructor]|uniref:Uncharacterized protein n=1 Tax=Varroa destructor TaxID=109461 RepID=A0A7M7K6C2_VARDE|nr:uncharacterized protein LOC111250315 [Varroa destructor]
MVVFSGSRSRRHSRSRPVSVRHRRRLQRNRLPSRRCTTLRGGVRASSEQATDAGKDALSRRASLKSTDALAKLIGFMSLMTIYLRGKNELQQVFPTYRGVDILKYMLTQMKNPDIDEETKRNLIDFSICLLNQIEISMINFVDPESEGPEADAGFIVELGELGTVTQTKPIIVDFMDLYDGNPYSHQEGIEYYRWLESKFPDFPDWPMLSHVNDREWKSRLLSGVIRTEPNSMTLEYKCDPLDPKNPEAAFQTTLRLKWPGPATQLASVMSRIRTKIDNDFAAIDEIISALRENLAAVPDMKRMMDEATFSLNQNDTEDAYDLLRQFENWRDYFCSLYERMFQLKKAYTDPENRKTVHDVYVRPEEDNQIVCAMKAWAADVDGFKKRCEALQKPEKS